jgi:hypothetical protein
MTDRQNQRRLDDIAMNYLAAIEAGDFDAIEALWKQAADDSELYAMLHGLNAELAAERDAAENAAIDAIVLDNIEKHMPSAEVIRAWTGPLTVAEVAEQIRRHPPAGLTVDDLKLNDVLLKSTDAVPAGLGISQVIEWGKRFGVAPEIFWQAFRKNALKLRMRRESEANYQIAARPTKPKPPEGKS